MALTVPRPRVLDAFLREADGAGRWPIALEPEQHHAIAAHVRRLEAVVEAARRLEPVRTTVGGLLNTPETVVDDDAAEDLHRALTALEGGEGSHGE